MNKKVNFLIIVAALGYFVDIYDLIVFNVVKQESLLDFIPANLMDKTDTFLFNCQMTGMLLGGIIWGILGDKKGRVSVLFGSIVLYSLANLANAFVTDIPSYALARFLAGIGLAGELGAGITLVSETMEKSKRGIGTMIIVSVGALGAIAAAIVGKNGHYLVSFLDSAFSISLKNWQVTYLVGGVLGLILLFLRAGTYESGMYKSVETNKTVKKGNLLNLLSNKNNLIKYLACIAIGLPIWFTIGVLINKSHLFARSLSVEIKVADSVMFAYIGLSFGDLLSGMFSQWFKSRKKVIFAYLGLSLVLYFIYLFNNQVSVNYFKWMCFLLGTATGYWALFVTVACEQFGTNIRSTVTNTVPNFVRGAVVPITLGFAALQSNIGLNITSSALVVGLICLILAIVSTAFISESFHKDLDYVEE
ncbi:MAG: MFS transporter [Candidatus Methylacidiphilales bacterium]